MATRVGVVHGRFQPFHKKGIWTLGERHIASHPNSYKVRVMGSYYAPILASTDKKHMGEKRYLRALSSLRTEKSGLLVDESLRE